MSNVVRVAGGDPNYVYLDNTGAVRIVESATVTDVLGLGGITITDVAADLLEFADGYMAISDAGALYRFSVASPTAVEDTEVTGITSLHLSMLGLGRLFAITAGGVWDLFAESSDRWRRFSGSGGRTLGASLPGIVLFQCWTFFQGLPGSSRCPSLPRGKRDENPQRVWMAHF